LEKVELANKAVDDVHVLELLNEHNPQLVSTIFVGLDTPASDIDIVCQYADQDQFSNRLSQEFGDYIDFECKVHLTSVVARFSYQNFQFEIYGSRVSVEKQNAVRHFNEMKRLVDVGGESFQQIIKIKKAKGLKTEPAIAEFLGLKGDAYKAVSELRFLSRNALESLVSVAFDSLESRSILS